MSPSRRTLSVGGTHAPMIEAGPADATEAVVFVHGNPGSSSDWTALLDAAGAVGRAVAIDMPGFGKAHVPPGFGYDVESYAGFLEQARGELGIERVHLVVHDFGGPFGLAWGLANPQRLASVVLMNVGVMPGYKWHSMAKRWRTPVLGELTQAFIPRAAWRRVMQASSPRGLPPEFVDKMYDDYDRETRRTVLALYRNTPDPGDRAQEIGAALAQLNKPALVIWGASDPFLSADYAERQRDYFDVEQVALLPGSGHWAFQDDPARVRELVVPFVERQLASSPARGGETSASAGTDAPSAA
ncbi:MAG TPA: alpha/beta hydrolase [Solirubrobacteraceae bacterium]|nr:alpha/beta hydrolase [Solirubrobacteraceae bacterium]